MIFEEKQNGLGAHEFPDDFVDGENEVEDDPNKKVADDPNDNDNDDDPSDDPEYEYADELGDSDADENLDEDYVQDELQVKNLESTSNTSVPW